MSNFAEGGNDTFIASGGPSANTFFGDAQGDMSDFAKGGNDTFIGSTNTSNHFYGDAGGNMSGHAQGGDDLAVLPGSEGPSAGPGTFNIDIAFGDALTMSGNAVGGKHTLTGGDTSGSGDMHYQLFGDAESMSESAKAGNDTLTGGNNAGTGTVSNVLFGDAEFMSGSAKGGDDTLIAGTAAPGSTTAGTDQITLHNFTGSVTANDFLFV